MRLSTASRGICEPTASEYRSAIWRSNSSVFFSDRSTRALSSSIGRAALGVAAAAALAGTERGRRFASRWLIVAPLRAVLPAVWILKIIRWRAKIRDGNVQTIGQLARVYGRHFLRFWLTLEIYFYFIYLWKYRQLNRKAHLPPLCEGPSRCPTRIERLKRCLRGLHEIHVHTAVNPTHSASEPMLERCTSQSQQLIGSKDPHQNLNKEAQSLLDVCNWSPSSRRRGRLGSVGSKTDFTCEQLVREWEQTHNKGIGFQQKLLANCSALLSMLQFSCNVIREDELPIHTGSGLFATEGSTVDDDMWAVRVRALLRAEISSWYFGAPVDSLQRGNLEEWVAEYFFEYRQADELSIAEKQELRVLVDYLAEWAHISGDLRDGTNEDVKCMRIMNDPIPAAYRPFICYGVTHFVLPIITDIVLDKAVGFTKYRSGTMEYWYSRAPEGENPTLQPIV
ncbi:hypothetical protein FOZ63_032261 [Perkinsus olseni]|uniref:Uncharacterized protein n=1 Tax=Perkinsus olseni TaxID=32597 RepID=A0A7J6PE81_PEROL|nr:hypothetical protein FOZ63_032261 [Perkinsus olseni]